MIKNMRPRPLPRDKDGLRDDKLFIVACDDTYAPKQYFSFFNFSRLRVYVAETTDNNCHAQAVLDRLLRIKFEDGDERWLLLDTDHYVQNSHIKQFKAVLKKAKQKKINVILSKPSFDVWLLMHHSDRKCVSAINNASEAEKELKRILGSYNKRRLVSADYKPSSVVKACKLAINIDSKPNEIIPSEPGSRVYKLWKAIAMSVPKSGIPEYLNDIRKL
jgi:hypothetical protein